MQDYKSNGVAVSDILQTMEFIHDHEMAPLLVNNIINDRNLMGDDWRTSPESLLNKVKGRYRDVYWCIPEKPSSFSAHPRILPKKNRPVTYPSSSSLLLFHFFLTRRKNISCRPLARFFRLTFEKPR